MCAYRASLLLCVCVFKGVGRGDKLKIVGFFLTFFAVFKAEQSMVAPIGKFRLCSV